MPNFMIFSLNFRIGRGRRLKKLDIEPYHTLLKYHDDDEIRGSLLTADYSATVNRAIKVSGIILWILFEIIIEIF